jgi:hypothetical protein
VTGQVISMGIATLIIHILMGESKISPENTGLFIKSVKVIFIVLLACACSAFMLHLPEARKTNNNYLRYLQIIH